MAKTVKISQQTWKQIDDNLKDRSISVESSLGSGRGNLITVPAQNDSQVDIARFDVVSLAGILIGPEAPAFHEGKYGMICMDTLTSPDFPYGVATEPIAVGAIGNIVLFGHSAVKVNVTDLTHMYAIPSTTVAGQLDAAASGPFRLIWREAIVGLVWGVAMFPQPQGGGGISWFVVNNFTTNPMSCYEVVFNGTTWDQIGVTPVDVYVYPNLSGTTHHYRDGTYLAAVQSGGRWVSLYSLPSYFALYQQG